MQITLTEQKLLDASHTMKAYLAKKGITQDGKAIGMALCRAILTESLTSRSYEQLHRTGALAENNAPPSVSVFIFWYGSEAVLTRFAPTNDPDQAPFTLEYIRCQGAGTDLEVSIDELRYQGEQLAGVFDTALEEYTLPEVLADDWEYDDVLRLAADMGYDRPGPRLLDRLQAQNYSKIFINDVYCPHSLNGDWQETVEGAVDEHDIPEGEVYFTRALDACVWYADCQDGVELYEHMFTLRQLCLAQYQHSEGSGDTWFIPGEDNASPGAIVTLY